MKRLILPILILSFSFASAQEIVSNQEVSEDTFTTVSTEVVVNVNEEVKDLEVAYTPKTLRDPDNIDFDNLDKEKQLELFETKRHNIC